MSGRQKVYLVYGYDLEKMNPYPLDILTDVTEVFPTVYRRRNEGHVVSAREQEVYDIDEMLKEGAL
ncbi:hypothetical protein COK15_28100 [Bacillus cereus]|uniref:hypothetical protein n=1 Tax=Bacillus cereus TaxID=1396 RepID=UPI000BF63015|nr:hypothetical protein [Bacillus cereus]PFQ72403.1 hypothetical protein COK15_28100 [Bacillus cereus]